jgi:hypothetical protein
MNPTQTQLGEGKFDHRKVLILTGNYQQYKHCLKENSLKSTEAIYVRSRFDMFGTIAKKVICYGTYFENPYFDELKIEAESRIREL